MAALELFLVLLVAMIVLVKASERFITSSIKLSEWLGVSQLSFGYLFIALATNVGAATVTLATIGRSASM